LLLLRPLMEPIRV